MMESLENKYVRCPMCEGSGLTKEGQRLSYRFYPTFWDLSLAKLNPTHEEIELLLANSFIHISNTYFKLQEQQWQYKDNKTNSWITCSKPEIPTSQHFLIQYIKWSDAYNVANLLLDKNFHKCKICSGKGVVPK